MMSHYADPLYSDGPFRGPLPHYTMVRCFAVHFRYLVSIWNLVNLPYVNFKKAFDPVDRRSLWDFLCRHGSPAGILSLTSTLCYHDRPCPGCRESMVITGSWDYQEGCAHGTPLAGNPWAGAEPWPPRCATPACNPISSSSSSKSNELN